MRKNKIISLILVSVMVFALIPFGLINVSAADTWDGTYTNSFASGNGSQSNPYIINTAEQLAFFARAVLGGEDFKDSYIKLNADIILNDISGDEWFSASNANIWQPIGYIDWNTYEGKYFSGTFDGGNHTVTGITMGTENEYSLGFFGATSGATIKNLKLNGVAVTCPKDAGGVVGYASYGDTIVNCHVTKAYIAAVTQRHAGGIVGRASGLALIDGCSAEGEVFAPDIAGGIAGDASGSEAKIKNCENKATVTGNGYVGGIAGDATGEKLIISDCVNNGIITAAEGDGVGSGGDFAGGIAGNLMGSVINCENNKNISANDSVGGIVGSSYGYSAEKDSLIKFCVNNGEVAGGIDRDVADENAYNGYNIGGILGKGSSTDLIACVNNGAVMGFLEVGGIIGSGSKGIYIESCANYGNILGRADETNSSLVSLEDCFGGIAGILYDSKVYRCENHAMVGGGDSVGGIVGSINNSENLDDEVTTVNISDCYNCGNIVAYGNAGGLVGITNGGTIANSYNAGKVVTAGTFEYDMGSAGGIVGFNKGVELSNCKYLDTTARMGCDIYYDGASYSKLNYSADIEGVTRLSDAQMKDAANFGGYDFVEIWIMDAETEYAYPELIPYEEDGMLGDVNDNDKIDMTDYILLKRAYFGTYDFDETQNVRGDINKNEKIDMTDYILLKRVYFGTYTIQ